jgi:hypothetical protein
MRLGLKFEQDLITSWTGFERLRDLGSLSREALRALKEALNKIFRDEH